MAATCLTDRYLQHSSPLTICASSKQNKDCSKVVQKSCINARILAERTSGRAENISANLPSTTRVLPSDLRQLSVFSYLINTRSDIQLTCPVTRVDNVDNGHDDESLDVITTTSQEASRPDGAVGTYHNS